MKINKLLLGAIILFLLFLWSSNYAVVSYALNSVSPEGLALSRFAIASLLLLVVAVIKKIKIPEVKDIPVITFCGFMGVTFYNFALNFSERTVTAGSASLILNTYPIFVTLLSGLILKEKVSILKWLGIMISFGGILLITLGENKAGVSINVGIFILLLSAIAISCFDVAQKKLMGRYTPLEVTSYFIWTGTLFMAVVCTPALIKDMAVMKPDALLSIIYLGIFPSTMACLLWANLVSRYPLSALSGIFYIIPFFTMLLAFILMHQTTSLLAVVGGCIALMGVFIMNFNLSGNNFKRKFKRAKFFVILSLNYRIYKRRKLKFAGLSK